MTGMARGKLALVAGALTLAALTAPAGDGQAMRNGGRVSTPVATPKIASVTLAGPCNLAVDDTVDSDAE